MKQYSLFWLMLFMFVAGKAQDSLSLRDQNLMRELNMDVQSYNVFAKAIKEYEQKALNLHKDKFLTFQEQRGAIEKLHNEKKDYISTHLSPEQQRLLDAYYKRNERHSAAYYKRQEQMEKLKQQAVKQN